MDTIRHYWRLSVWLVAFPFWFTYYVVNFTVRGVLSGVCVSCTSWARGWRYLWSGR